MCLDGRYLLDGAILLICFRLSSLYRITIISGLTSKHIDKCILLIYFAGWIIPLNGFLTGVASFPVSLPLTFKKCIIPSSPFSSYSLWHITIMFQRGYKYNSVKLDRECLLVFDLLKITCFCINLLSVFVGVLVYFAVSLVLFLA